MFSEDLGWQKWPTAPTPPAPREPHTDTATAQRARRRALWERDLAALGHPADCRCRYECGPIHARLAELGEPPR